MPHLTVHVQEEGTKAHSDLCNPRSTGSCTKQSSPVTLFVDSSAYKAFNDEEDEYHAASRGFTDDIAAKKVPVHGLITSDDIRDETITLIRFAHSQTKAVEFAQAITSSRATRLLYVSQENFAKALELFSQASDKA